MEKVRDRNSNGEAVKWTAKQNNTCNRLLCVWCHLAMNHARSCDWLELLMISWNHWLMLRDGELSFAAKCTKKAPKRLAIETVKHSATFIYQDQECYCSDEFFMPRTNCVQMTQNWHKTVPPFWFVSLASLPLLLWLQTFNIGFSVQKNLQDQRHFFCRAVALSW